MRLKYLAHKWNIDKIDSKQKLWRKFRPPIDVKNLDEINLPT
jgi:hypothetical protein